MRNVSKAKQTMTRILVIGGALAAAVLCGGWTFGFDREGPYCLNDQEYMNCGFPSAAACWATASGAGGYCHENPRYVAAPERQPRRKKTR